MTHVTKPVAISSAAQLFQEISPTSNNGIGSLLFGEMLVHVRSLASKMKGELTSYKTDFAKSDLSAARTLVRLYHEHAATLVKDKTHAAEYVRIGKAMRKWSQFDLLDNETKNLIIKTRRLFMNPIASFFSRLYETLHTIKLVLSSYPKLTPKERKNVFEEIRDTETEIFSILKNHTREKAIQNLSNLRNSLEEMTHSPHLKPIYKALADQIKSLEKEFAHISDETFKKYQSIAKKYEKSILEDTKELAKPKAPKKGPAQKPLDKTEFIETLTQAVEEARKHAESAKEDIQDVITEIETETKHLLDTENDKDECRSLIERALTLLKELSQEPQDPTFSEWITKIYNQIPPKESENLLREGKKKGWLNKRFPKMLNGTVLHLLAKRKESTEMKKLTELALTLGCKPELQDEMDNTPLTWAIANANNGTAMTILNTAKQGEYLNAQSMYNNTALHLAVGKGYKKKSASGDTLSYSNLVLVQKLIDLGAKVDLQDKDGDTPLHVACIRRDKEMISALLKAGATIDIKNNDGKTPLDMLNLSYKQASKHVCDKVNVFLLNKEEFEKATDLENLFLGH